MAGGGSEDGRSLGFTPTWIIAIVCTVIISMSLFFVRLLHYVGKVCMEAPTLRISYVCRKIVEVPVYYQRLILTTISYFGLPFLMKEIMAVRKL
jgi:Mlo family